jgi:arsenite-transporting ATPase
MNPEKMVIKESQRVFTYLSLFGFPVDCIVMNRILPEGIEDAHFERWKRVQKRHLKTAEECFNPLPIFEAALQKTEVIGVRLLGSMARDVFGPRDPTTVFFEGEPMRILQENGEYTMELMLPFATSRNADVWARGEELIISIGGFRRNIFLPRRLVGLDILEAKLREGVLSVRFTGAGKERGENE